jgi:rod shape-determining protein MreC
VHGTLKGQDHSTVKIDYVQNEENVEQGEWFFTSGDDRIFPKGLPAGQATVVRAGSKSKEIFVTPSGFQNGLEEVLIIVGGVHMDIPRNRQVLRRSTCCLRRQARPLRPQPARRCSLAR